jgi:hypothetical protein
MNDFFLQIQSKRRTLGPYACRGLLSWENTKFYSKRRRAERKRKPNGQYLSTEATESQIDIASGLMSAAP